MASIKDSLVIIPTYNEKENIEAIIRKVLSLPQQFNILVVDDNSPDGTAEIVKDIQKEFSSVHLMQRRGKLGLGTAYIAGFKYALENNYQYIFEMDADFSHNPKDLVRLRKACAEDGFDVAIGSRYCDGVNVINWPMGRVLLSFFASQYVKFITGMPVNDATAGFICYRKEVLETINLDRIKFVGYAFQIGMKFSAWKFGFRLKEVSIIFTDRTKGTSKMTTSIVREAVFGVLGMKLKSFFKNYKRSSVEQGTKGVEQGANH